MQFIQNLRGICAFLQNFKTCQIQYRCYQTYVSNYYPPPKAEGYRFVHVRPSFHPSVRRHYYVTSERNFMKLILNMYHYNDVMHVKFGPAGLGSS